jgi:hypothetical protein
MFGRLISVSGTEVTPDYEVLIEAGQAYDIVAPGNDGALQTRSDYGPWASATSRFPLDRRGRIVLPND